MIDHDRQPHPLARRHGRDQEVPDHAVVRLEPLLHLDDAAPPIGHAERDVDVLDDPRLETLAELEDRGLAHRRVDVVAVEHVDAEQVEDRLGGAAPHRDAGHVERRRPVRLAHIARPLGMEREFALPVGRLGLGRLIPLVAREEVALQDQFAVRDRPRVDRPGLDDPDGKALDRARRAQFVAAPRQDHVVEAAPGDERGRRGEAEAHRQRNGPLVVIVLGDDLPHVGAGRRLERADVPPAGVHAVVADVAPAVEIRADDDAVAAADRPLRLELRVPDRHHVPVDLEVVGDDLLLAGRLTRRHLHGGNRMGERVGQPARSVRRAVPAKHPVEDVHVGEQVGDGPRVGIALHVLEQQRVAPVQLLLHAGHLEIGVHRHRRFQQQTLLPQPLERSAQGLDAARHLHRNGHRSSLP